MGQRLVVDIYRSGKRIANVYYHWGAYTLSAMEILEDLINTYNSNRFNKEGVLLDDLNDYEFMAAIAANMKGKGGLDTSEEAYMREKCPGTRLRLAEDRNDGIISVSKEQMANSDSFSEGVASIDFTSKTFSIDGVVFSYYYDEDFKREYIGEMCGWTEEAIEIFNPNKLPAVHSLNRVPFLRAEKLHKTLNRISNQGGLFTCKDDTEGIYCIIE